MDYIYLVVGYLIAFGLGMLYHKFSRNDKLDTQVMDNIMAGKRVIICVDDEATIFQMYGDRIRISKATTTFHMMDEEDNGEVPYDLVAGMANNSFDQSDSGSETGVSDETRT